MEDGNPAGEEDAKSASEMRGMLEFPLDRELGTQIVVFVVARYKHVKTQDLC